MSEKSMLFIDGYDTPEVIPYTEANTLLKVKPDGSGFEWGVYNGYSTNNSELFKNSSSNSNNDEFNTSIIDPNWTLSEMTGGTTVTPASDVNAYDTSFTSGSPRLTQNPETRRSWLLMQPPSNSTRYFLNKTYTFPTNVLIVSRLRFSQRLTITALDHWVGLMISESSGGLPDVDNTLSTILCRSESNLLRGSYENISAGSPSIVNETYFDLGSGHPLQYAALHKIGTTYYSWLGTVSGNWIYMGSVTTARSFDRVGVGISNTSNTAPGPSVLGVDFIRFYETDNFIF